MEAAQWHPISGTNSAEVYPYLRKPNVFSCNSYIIRTPHSIAVIDPGGLPEQTKVLLPLVRSLLREKPRPVYVLLTHCHVDHSLEVIKGGAWEEFPSLKVVIHAAGAISLRTADRRTTQAEILGLDLPPFEADISLFPPPEAPSPAVAPLSSESILLNPPDVIEAYAVPGHSPDSVCYRLGSALFIGDVLAAVSPMIAGAPGWNRDELVTSVKGIMGLLETNDIRVCFPGHGQPISGEKINAALARTLQEAIALTGIETSDADRVKYISGYAQELFEELGTAFMLIHKRIGDLSRRLHQLEEWSASKTIARILDSEQVSQFLLDFRNFQESFLAGEVVEVQVALKAIQLIRRIARLLVYEELDEIVDPSLLRLTRTLLNDFINAAQGLRLTEEKQESDLNEMVGTLAAEMKRTPGEGVSIEEIPDDPDGFRDYLIRALASVPTFEGVEIVVSPGAAEGTPSVLVVRERFLDALKRLLEDLAEGGAKSIAFTVQYRETRPCLVVRVEFARPIYQLGDQRLKPHRRRLSLSGARMAVRYSSQALDFTLQF